MHLRISEKPVFALDEMLNVVFQVWIQKEEERISGRNSAEADYESEA